MGTADMRHPPPNLDHIAEAIRFGISRSEARRLWALGGPHEAPGGGDLMADMSHDRAVMLEARAADARAAMSTATIAAIRRHYEVVACNAEAEAILERIAVDSWNDRAAKMRAYVAWMNEAEMEIAA